jgi:hypothetical protein
VVRRGAVCAVLAALLAACAPAGAHAAYGVGFSEQQPEMFASPLFRSLNVKYARLIVSYDALKHDFERQEVNTWLFAATLAGVEPLLSLNHSRNCFARTCKLPSVAAYTTQFRAIHRQWPSVKTISPWNEVNHFSQPTYRNPRRAASYYNVARQYCIGCKIIAADVLDQAGVGHYLKTFLRYAKGTPRIWGLHNYSDTNRFRSTGTREVLRTVKGQIWLTETGGVVKFGAAFPFNPSRAARATSFMFTLANLFPRITRLYIYQWTGARLGARFDSGVTDALGKPRPAYYVLKAHIPRKTPLPPVEQPATPALDG